MLTTLEQKALPRNKQIVYAFGMMVSNIRHKIIWCNFLLFIFYSSIFSKPIRQKQPLKLAQ